MSNNSNTRKQNFVDSFKSISENLATRYSINMHLDFINEFIKFADNTRDIDLLNSILYNIQEAECVIIKLIEDYENKSKCEENAY